MTKKFKPTTTIAFALFLILAMSASIVLVPDTLAHDPAWKIPTFAYINVSPNPIGVGQQAFVTVWLDKMPAGTVIGNNIRLHDYKLTITKPDGTNETKTWDTVTDTTSSAYTTYSPDATGVYTFTFEFPGQVYTWTQANTPGLSAGNAAYQNDTYLPSKATTTLTVQEEAIPTAPNYPLPTEYWTRPIEGQNTDWYLIGSNFLDPLRRSLLLWFTTTSTRRHST